MPSTPKNLKPNADGCAERKKFRAADFFSSLLARKQEPDYNILMLTIHLPGLETTARIARILAPLLRTGDVVALEVDELEVAACVSDNDELKDAGAVSEPVGLLGWVAVEDAVPDGDC
jgi:hypothetical protein